MSTDFFPPSHFSDSRFFIFSPFFVFHLSFPPVFDYSYTSSTVTPMKRLFAWSVPEPVRACYSELHWQDELHKKSNTRTVQTRRPLLLYRVSSILISPWGCSDYQWEIQHQETKLIYGVYPTYISHTYTPYCDSRNSNNAHQT